ncbi:SDR family oxidoreductase [Lentibacter algarum]|uniref:SDR family NAD(P)-dependent oxidoreductase n=1 Tax=Lentibacter algarum TaxID=576131 RepID=UPI001C084D5A|nr:SDR family oxidoreductase [Lentibacter algarum]MBU2983599.1 SDR family oxidoreductase [Lentibacter algarum]
MNLMGKTVVVTGGSDGIGKHICLKLAEQGCNLAIIGRNAERLSDVKERCLAGGAQQVRSFTCDIQNVAQLEQTAQDILTAFNGVDILINNAGIWHKTSPLDEIDAEMLEATVQTNLTALMQLTRFLIADMRKKPEAIVLNVASKSGVVAQAGQSVYTATKYGVRGFTEVLKADEQDTSIRVAGLYQSGTNTQMFSKANEDVPNHIFTEPEDLADVVVFMLSRPPKIWLHDVRVEL